MREKTARGAKYSDAHCYKLSRGHKHFNEAKEKSLLAIIAKGGVPIRK